MASIQQDIYRIEHRMSCSKETLPNDNIVRASFLPGRGAADRLLKKYSPDHKQWYIELG